MQKILVQAEQVMSLFLKGPPDPVFWVDVNIIHFVEYIVVHLAIGYYRLTDSATITPTKYPVLLL